MTQGIEVENTIKVSLGKNKFDNKPVQCESANFDEFTDDVLNKAHESAEKGETFICAPMAVGCHSKPEEWVGEAAWRQKHLAEPRWYAPFDFDGFSSPEMFLEVLGYLKRYKGFAYTTASHTREAPRCRVVLMQTKATDREDGIAVCKAVQAELERKLGDDAVKFDTSVYKGEQPLYTPVQGAQAFRFTGKPVDVDAMLMLAPAPATKPKASMKSPLETAKTDDPTLRILYELNMVRGDQGGGKFNIECPFAHEHSSATDDSSTVYYQKYTGGYKEAHIHCLHGHCEKRKTNDFMLALLARYTQQTGKVESKDVNASKANHLTTDLANAERLMRELGNNVLSASGQPHIWTGTHWYHDKAASYLQTLELSRLIKAEADTWEQRPYDSDEERKKYAEIAAALRKWSKESENIGRLSAAFSLLMSMVEIPASKLDSNPYLLNVQNGTIDLRTCELREHKKGDLITHCIPLHYDPKAEAPLFKKALAEITGEAGAESQPVAKFMQRWFGYGATGVTIEHVFAIFQGDGCNGKSVLQEAVARVLDSYAGTAAPGLLVGNRQDKHPVEIADLRGKRMVTAHESDENGRLREGFVKQATGGDTLCGRFMHSNLFQFTPTHKIQLLTNFKPTITGRDRGMWRRVLLIPFNTIFGTAVEVTQGFAHYVRDNHLAERLKSEDAGILTWIVLGAAQWYAMGLNPPDAVLKACDDYRKQQDRIRQFINECCERDPEAFVPLSGERADAMGIYYAYTFWAKSSGYLALGKNNFSEELERFPGIKKEERKVKTLDKWTHTTGFEGVRLTAEVVNEIVLHRR
ncbi:DNA primase family protein [Pseudomonas sp. LB3P14]